VRGICLPPRRAEVTHEAEGSSSSPSVSHCASPVHAAPGDPRSSRASWNGLPSSPSNRSCDRTKRRGWLYADVEAAKRFATRCSPPVARLTVIGREASRPFEITANALPRGRHRASACAPPLRQRDHGRVGGSAHHHARTLRGIASIGLTRGPRFPRSPSRAVSCEPPPRLGVARPERRDGWSSRYGRCRRRPLVAVRRTRARWSSSISSSVRSMVDRSRRVCPSPCTAHLVTRSFRRWVSSFRIRKRRKITHGAATTLRSASLATSRNRPPA